jgi:hypothetical protein
MTDKNDDSGGVAGRIRRRGRPLVVDGGGGGASISASERRGAPALCTLLRRTLALLRTSTQLMGTLK